MKRILVATGIYPPEIGGPAQYAKNIAEAFRHSGAEVKVSTYRWEKKLPTGLRHLVFFFKVLGPLFWSDWTLVLDTFSVGLPTILAGQLLGKRTIIRTGGDFLWETYVERTGDLVLLSRFYQTTKARWSLKDKLVFWLTGWTLRHATLVIFSTDWQRQIFLGPYRLDLQRTAVVENFYGPRAALESELTSVTSKVFVSGSRVLKWKNKERLREAFDRAQAKRPELQLDDTNAPYEKFLEKISRSYAVILVSLGDISPNMILDALRFRKPFILTRENGLNNRLGSLALLVDPENPKEIEEKILWLADEKHYEAKVAELKAFTFTHSWSQMAEEFTALAANL